MKYQLNLVPDVKLDFLKAQRSRNTVVSSAVLVSLVSLAIFIITFFSISVVQRGQLKNVDKNITTANSRLKDLKGLDQVLTVQNQLHSLVDLHKNKHITSRIFTYLQQTTPTSVQISRLSLDLAGNSLQINGSANSQVAINTYIDTLKFTTYTTTKDSKAKTAFVSVIESGFSVAAGNASFSLSVTFDPVLFANNLTDTDGHPVAPTLSVPKLTTTRSAIDNPTNLLFNGPGGQ